MTIARDSEFPWPENVELVVHELTLPEKANSIHFCLNWLNDNANGKTIMIPRRSVFFITTSMISGVEKTGWRQLGRHSVYCVATIT
mgnify:CR=1 FL=1